MPRIETPSLIVRLIEEHQTFTAEFDRLLAEARSETARRPDLYESLRRLCFHFLEEFHHRKEERLLFSEIAAHPRLSEGGPECVLHFDYRMRHPPVEEAVETCRTAGWSDARPSWDGVSDALRVRSSPLSIPVEDHEAGRILLEGIRRRLAGPEPEAAVRVIDGLFERYRELQVMHFRREEGCLFRLCQTLIPPSRWSELERLEPRWSGPACGGSAEARAPSDGRD